MRFVATISAVLLCCGAILASGGCAEQPPAGEAVQMDLTLDPSPPTVGTADISLQLSSVDGTPLTGAEVRVEGNMNHAGMKPSFADLHEVEPGRYAGMLDFTMGGDWFLLISIESPAGGTITRKVDVRGVTAK